MPSVRVRSARLVAAAVAIQATFVFFFVFPGHDPRPNGLQVGAVASPPATDALARQLARRSDGFEVRRFATEAAARRAIEQRDVYGAFVVGDEGPMSVLTAPAASFTVATLLEEIGRGAGVSRVQEVVPLDAEDPRGVTLNLLVLPIIVTSI